MKKILVVLGVLSLVLGIIGIAVPLLPTPAPSSYGDVYTSVVRSEEQEEMARRQAAIRVFTLPDMGVYLRAAAYHPLSNYRCHMRIFFPLYGHNAKKSNGPNG